MPNLTNTCGNGSPEGVFSALQGSTYQRWDGPPFFYLKESGSGNTGWAAVERTANKDAASGYAGLDGSTKLAIAQVPTGSTSTTVCLGNDSRLSDSRAPNGTAAGDLAGSYPNPTVKASVSLTTPNIGAATGTSLAVTGAITSSGGGLGYATGNGGQVTQATSKSTGVTLNKLCGTITMNAAALASATTVSFTLTNSTVAATDFVAVNHASAGTLGAYNFAVAPAAGSVVISVRNIHTASLSEAIVLRYFVNKAVTS